MVGLDDNRLQSKSRDLCIILFAIMLYTIACESEAYLSLGRICTRTLRFLTQLGLTRSQNLSPKLGIASVRFYFNILFDSPRFQCKHSFYLSINYVSNLVADLIGSALLVFALSSFLLSNLCLGATSI